MEVMKVDRHTRKRMRERRRDSQYTNTVTPVRRRTTIQTAYYNRERREWLRMG